MYEPSRFNNVPDGEYHVVVESVRLGAARGGSPMVVWFLKITDPQFSDRYLKKKRVITTKTLLCLKDDLEKCGLRLERLSELPHYIDHMVGAELTVVQKSGQRRNGVYIKWPRRRNPPPGYETPF